MTFVEAALFFPSVVGAISVFWLLAYVLRNIRRDRMNEVGGLDHLDDLRWNGWSLVMGWPPVTCWQGCAHLHRDDWWKAYVEQTCWPGCADLHREDWWKAYVDQADGREQTLGTRSLDLGRTPHRSSAKNPVRVPRRRTLILRSPDRLTP